jgi:acid stress-induced BolA-like protein IbaG/YrbA
MQDIIKSLLESQISDCQVQSVEVQGDHIGLVLVSPAFAGLTPVKKQQLVLAPLAELFSSKKIHAIDYIKAFTPEQWQQQPQ